jgi:hypothetical protein
VVEEEQAVQNRAREKIIVAAIYCNTIQYYLLLRCFNIAIIIIENFVTIVLQYIVP